MPSFKELKTNNDLKEIIKSAFDSDLSVDGAWGYSRETTTHIKTNNTNITLKQFEHTLASMRAYLEMNMTQEKAERYGSIDLNEVCRKQIKEDHLIYDFVEYKITAIKEVDYEQFIEEYKENYGKSEFDISNHFLRRKEATIERLVNYWFEVSSVIET